MTELLVQKAMKLIEEKTNIDDLSAFNYIEVVLSDLYYDAFKAGQETRSDADYDEGHRDGYRDACDDAVLE